MGRAHHQAGRQDLARAAWIEALRVIPSTAAADAAEVRQLLHAIS